MIKIFVQKHIPHAKSPIWSVCLCYEVSVFPEAAEGSACFIHFFSNLFRESESNPLFPSGWTARRRWKTLLLFSLPYAPETVPSSAPDYARAQMLCHPLPPERLNREICLDGMGAQCLEGLGCGRKDLVTIAAINKCSRNDHCLLSMQGSEQLRKKTKQKSHMAAAVLPSFISFSHKTVSSLAIKPCSSSAEDDGVRNMQSNAHLQWAGLRLNRKKKIQQQLWSSKRLMPNFQRVFEALMLASIHGHVLSSVLFVLLPLCIQDLLLRGIWGAKTFLWKIMRTSATSAAKQNTDSKNRERSKQNNSKAGREMSLQPARKSHNWQMPTELPFSGVPGAPTQTPTGLPWQCLSGTWLPNNLQDKQDHRSLTHLCSLELKRFG